jgi:hypothetical protein
MRLLHLNRLRKRRNLRRGEPDTPADTAAQHVTTERLKHQFEERLAARTQRGDRTQT